MKKIALDVDDVIAAFTPHAHSWYGIPLKKTDYWSVPNMDSILGVGWFGKIAPITEFWDTIPCLTNPNDIDFDFHYYISSFPKEMYYSRMRWLEKHGFPARPLIVSHNKLDTCKELGVSVLIDDKPEMMKSLKDTDIRGIHFMTEYAGFEPVGEHVFNMKQVKDLLCEQRLFTV